MSRRLRSLGPAVPIVAVVVGAAALVAGVLVACRSDESVARETFARSFTCPDSRVTVSLRKDLAAVDLAIRPRTPPKDIAGDPERLAIWQKEAAREAAYYDGKSVIQARGCEHEVFYICGNLRVSVGATRHGCTDAPYPPEPRP